MLRHVPSAPAPVLAGVLGAVLLAVFWSLCLLAPAALIAGTGWALGLEFSTSFVLASSGLAATIFVLERVAGEPGLWRGM